MESLSLLYGYQVYDGDLDDYSDLACNQSGSFTWGDFVAELVEYEDSP